MALPFLLLGIALLAFVCEYVDSTLGGGYGTILTSALILIGFSPLMIVPCILLSQFLTGVTAALFHHRFGNVKFNPGSRELKVVAALSGFGTLGVLFAVGLGVSLPVTLVEAYIGLMALVMGVLLFLARNYQASFSWSKIIALGSASAFNKGISGGGYGPLVTTGQIFSGLSAKQAIACVSLAEGIISLAGVSAYLILGQHLDPELALGMITGALLTVPLSAYSVKKMTELVLRNAVALMLLLLGIAMLAKLIIP